MKFRLFYPVWFRCTGILAVKRTAKWNAIKFKSWVGNSLEAFKESMFTIQFLGSLKILFKLPITKRFDGVHPIFMESSITPTSCTKHLNIRYKYVNEYVEDRVVTIIFVKSTKNDSNVLTKNYIAELHEKHSNKLIGEELEWFPSLWKYLKFNGRVLEMWFYHQIFDSRILFELEEV